MARFLTKALYQESLNDEWHEAIRAEMAEIDLKGGVLFYSDLFLTPSQHWSRVFELPWAITEAGDLSERACLDIGSGFSPLPVYLARRAKSVLSIDIEPSLPLSTLLRDCGGTTLKTDFRAFDPCEKFDRIFCISVLEHIRTINIYNEINRLLSWLSAEGKLIITLDCRLPEAKYGFPPEDCLLIADRYGFEVEQVDEEDIISSTDFEDQCDFVGGNIGIFLMVIGA